MQRINRTIASAVAALHMRARGEHQDAPLPLTTMDASTTDMLAPALSPSSVSSLSSNVNVIGSAWVLSSAILTTYSTTTFLKYQGPEVIKRGAAGLSSLSRPALLTLYRFGGSLLLGILAHPDLQIEKRIQDTLQYIPAFTLPAAFLFVANYANSIALSRIGISLTYTSKCAIPLITVLLTLILDGKSALPSKETLLSLIPIALGIAAASWNSPTFEAFGFAAAMTSCAAQSALNVSSKRAMIKTGIAGAQAQRCMVAVGFCITAILSTISIVMHSSPTEASSVKSSEPPAWLSFMAVASYHLEYVLSFMFVKLVAPITYGACDAVRRLSIILSGHVMFGGEPFTPLNIAGIGLAILGALAYSITSSGGLKSSSSK
jgi:hypothetical protein